MITELLDMVRSWSAILQCFTVVFLSTVFAFFINGTINKLLSFFTYSLPVLIRGWPPENCTPVDEVLQNEE